MRSALLTLVITGWAIADSGDTGIPAAVELPSDYDSTIPPDVPGGGVEVSYAITVDSLVECGRAFVATSEEPTINCGFGFAFDSSTGSCSYVCFVGDP